MQDDVYGKLQAFLDLFPLGYPRTPSGVEMEILKRLFTEEEAALATLLSPFPEEAGQIASRTGRNASELEQGLESMAGKGLVFRARRNGKTFFNTAPFMIGLYEYSVKKLDGDLARLYSSYYEQAFQGEMGLSDIPGFKVIPLNENLRPMTALYPYPALEDEISKARVISVAECICRKEAALLGKACGGPLETCLHFGAAAEYYIENRIGRGIGADEALAIVKKADDAGLVHAGVNTRHLSNLCNCCPCCCASMKGITTKGLPRRKFLNPLYEALVDGDACTGCGACLDRCPVNALSLGDAASADREKCLGCGLCAGVCPAGAITISPRPDREEPFDRVIDMGLAILEGKTRNLLKK
jgi:Na+-translocating ferredoxin:NAD+ oxidoreductase subunit B